MSICSLTVLLSSIAAAQRPADRMPPHQVTSVPAGDVAMEAAFNEARATVDEFLAMLANPPPQTRGHGVKIRVTEAGKTEFIWVTGLERQGNGVSGRIANEPRSVSKVRMGQVVKIERSEIYDWMYLDDEKQRMFGNFTLCALLSRESPEEAAKARQSYGLDCDFDRPVNR